MPSARKPDKFVRRETPSQWPSSNRGWRLGVAFGAAIVLLVIAASLAALVGRVWDVG